MTTAAVLGTIVIASWLAACGLDENGEATSDASILDSPIADQVVKEVNPEANPPPLTCAEAGTPLDASCLGNPVPAGWQPIAMQVGANIGCGDGGFQPTPLVENPVMPSGACNCTGCGASGNWSCGASIKGGSTCTAETFDAGASVCWSNVNHSTYGVFITRGGNPQCGGGQQVGTQEAGATALSTCTPVSCDTDFCAMGSHGFSLCIYNANVSDGGCPPGFPVSHNVGPSASVACDNCQQCALTNPNAQCTGAVTAFSNNNCNGSNQGTTSAGACGDLGGSQYNSLFYDAGPVPVPNCGPTQGVNSGKVALDQPSTICCP